MYLNNFVFFLEFLKFWLLIWVNFGVICDSLGPNGLFFGVWVGVGFKNCFGVSSYRIITFVFWVILYHVVVVGGGVPSDHFVSNPITVMVVLLLGCDKELVRLVLIPKNWQAVLGSPKSWFPGSSRQFKFQFQVSVTSFKFKFQFNRIHVQILV